MNIVYRRATLDDLSNIQELNNNLFIKEYNEYDKSLKVGWPFSQKGEEYFKNAIEKDFCEIALDGDIFCGYIIGNIKSKYSYHINDIAVVDNMFILEEYRSHNIGSKLINDFISYCKENNVNDIRVTASSMNYAGINFYKKNGFREFEIILRKID